MCLISSSRDHQVMSSGDTSVVPSSIPNSDTKILSVSKNTEDTEQDTTKSLQPQLTGKENLSNNSSDFNVHEHSATLSNSNTLDVMAPGIREVTSLGAEEVGELRRENAQSAFEITSFRPATDDADKSMTGRPMSTDSLTLHTVPEKGESDESLATPTSKHHQIIDTQSEPMLQERDTAANVPERETATNERLDVIGNEASQGTVVASSPKLVPTVTDEPGSKPSTHTTGAAAQSGNGAGVQPNRFRRVNQYERGRWTIRDSLVTEEAAEGMQRQQPSEGLNPQQSPLMSTKHHLQHQDSGETSNGSTPPLKPAHQRSDSAMASSETPQPVPAEVTPPLSGITGGGLGPESASDRDSSSIHMDRSSTAAETLSRNTSMSSILAPEKSVDGDEILRDIDVDSVNGITGNQSSSQDQDLSDVPVVSPQPTVLAMISSSAGVASSPQPPIVTTSSSGAVPPSSYTGLPREEQQGTG
jgi:hypothetical protein